MNKSLHGLRILNTRPTTQAATLSAQIRAAGGESIECPALEIIPTQQDWVHTLPSLNTVDLAIFISSNAVTHTLMALEKNQIDWPETIKTIAIGTGTAKTLESRHIKVSQIPETQDSENLIQLPCFQNPPKNILLFKGMGGRDVIELQLSGMGHHVMPLVVYERIMPQIHPDYIKSLWQENKVDIILLTSAQSLQHLLTLFGSDARAWLESKIWLTISPRLTATARDAGIKNVITGSPDTIIETLLSL